LEVVLDTAFGSLLGGFLEAQMEPNGGQDGPKIGSKIKTNFEDDFGRPRGRPGPSRNPREGKLEGSVAGLARPVVSVFTALEALRGFDTPCTLRSAVGGESNAFGQSRHRALYLAGAQRDQGAKAVEVQWH